MKHNGNAKHKLKLESAKQQIASVRREMQQLKKTLVYLVNTEIRQHFLEPLSMICLSLTKQLSLNLHQDTDKAVADLEHLLTATKLNLESMLIHTRPH